MIHKVNCYIQYCFMILATLFSVSIFFSIVGFILIKGLPLINLTFIFSKNPMEGILPMIVATILIVAISVCLAFVVALSTALYLQEYAKENFFKKIIVFSIDSLVSIPSIVYGLFGLSFFVTTLHFGFSILSGALTVAIMILPIMINTIVEALKTVPKDLKAASYALGANQFQTITKVILPSIMDNIFTAIVLAIARVVGESAPFILTAGAVATMPKSIFSSARTLTTHMFLLINEGVSDNAIALAFASGAILICITLGLNILIKLIQYKMKGSN